jgi:serine/threonine-protein kinase
MATAALSLVLPERYELLRHIADGGMASVWCANDRVLGRRVAIKVLAEQFVHDARATARFKREARTAARLSSHPNVVSIFDVGETEAADHKRAFIVMEYLPAGTVADALRIGAVPPEEALRWIREAASALDHAHANGVIHRDIKPANLLLDGNRTVHVGDFGIARMATESTLTVAGQLFGTAAYLSPEQARGLPATEASDRYALAVTAFELLVGERPFKASNFVSQARSHIETTPPRASRVNPRVPRGVDAVLAQGLAKLPEDRWPTADAFAVALEDAHARRPVTVPTVPLLEVPRPARIAARASARRPRVLALAGFAAAALGLGIVAGASQKSTPRLARASVPPTTTVHHTAPVVPKRTTPAPTTTQAAQVPQTTTTQTAPTPPPTPTGADGLEAQGHQLMASGQYAAAVPVLRQAIAAASPSSLTYAYALYDLGRSLLLAGDAQAAIPILARRLQIPNQTGVVKQEFDSALRAVGAQLQHSHGNGNGNSQGPPGHDKRHVGGGQQD